ncbi:MAG: SusD/RagB family nutrient-binding outer membrane lipoprotein [Bacteroidaceae bacterium]|nr:SusD/RagB family nutrient-binding outer membrane lipoprotein [Bacteroidaceae bacterium]
MNKIIKYIFFGCTALAASSCSNLDEMNENPNSPQKVPSHMLMNGAEKWAVDNIYDVWFSGRQCLAYAQQWSQRNYTEEDRYQIRESTNNSYFNYLYQGIANFDKVIKLNTDEATASNNSAFGANDNQIAAATIMKVWLMDVITDTWGNVPYSEVAQLEDKGVLYCKYDDQKDVYKKMIDELTEAVNMIDVEEPAFTAGDVIFGGDASKWKKFGNSLKCRLAIHLSKVDENWRTYIAEALASGVMESNDDAAKFTYSESGSDYCQFYSGYFVSNRNDFSINKTLVDLMKGQSDTLNTKAHPWEGVFDPRLKVYTKPNANGEYKGMCVATSTGQQAEIFTADKVTSWYKNPPVCLTKTFAVPLMTYAEQKFIECEYNNYDIDDYKEGVRASIEYWSDIAGGIISADEQEAYVATVSANVNAEACAIQKYIDLFCNGTEAWTEIRRTGYPEQIVRPGEYCAVLDGTALKFSPLSDTKGDIISRVKYPTNESTLNGENWKAAVQKLKDGTNNYYSKMYWDVRTSTYDHPANK